MGYGAELVVVGVGGAGGNALITIDSDGVRGVRRIAANTDAQAVEHVSSHADAQPLQLGPRLTRGLGAGGRPKIGMEAAQEVMPEIAERLRGADLVFVTAGMGGGTGTGAAPVIAHIAHDLGALVVGVVTRPFGFEGRRRGRFASQGLDAMRSACDCLLVVPNDRLLEGSGADLSMVEAFRRADAVLGDAVRGVSDLVTEGGLINLDLADLREILVGGGRAVMGMGEATREKGGALAAVRLAMSCPLLDEDSIEGAGALLLNITAGPDLGLREAHGAASLLQAAARDDAELAFGVVTDPAMQGRVRVTLVATRFPSDAAEIRGQSAAGSEAKPAKPRNALVLLDNTVAPPRPKRRFGHV